MKLMAKIKKRDQKIAVTNTKRAADGDTNGSHDFASLDDEEHIDEFVKRTTVNRRMSTRIRQMTNTKECAAGQLPKLDPTRCSWQRFGPSELVCYRPAGAHNFQIMFADVILDRTIKWYHLTLQNVGMEKQYGTMSKHFYHPRLQERTTEIARTCEQCQKFKAQGKGYGHMAAREAAIAPSYEVAINTIGPWEIPVRQGNGV
jgi:hypothetical protein